MPIDNQNEQVEKVLGSNKIKSIAKKLEVCHITSVHNRYDIRIFIKECISLSQAGYKVSLIVADGLGDEIKNNISIYDVGKLNGRFKRMFFTPLKIYRQVLELKPKIVHFHDPELMPIALKLKTQGFKVVYDIHENLPKQVLSKYWIKKPLRKIVAFIVDRLELFVVKRMSGVVTVIDSIGQRFYSINPNVVLVHNYPYLQELKNYILPENKFLDDVTIINNWKSRQNNLVYIGGISKIRGIKPLINSLAISLLPLELAGPFSGIGLVEESKTWDGYNMVNYHGLLPHDEAFRLLSNAKIGILTLLPVPSYVESLPIKMFEYMLAGIPIVASNFKAWESIILKYNCGIMVDPNSPDDIAKACLWLINNPAEAALKGKNGFDAVLKHFNWEQESIKLIELYTKISITN